VRKRFVGIGERRRITGGNRVAPQTVLAVRFGSFELRSDSRRAERPDTGLVQTIYQTGHQRILWTHYDHRYFLVAGQRHDPIDIGGCEIDIATLLFVRGARISRRNEHSIDTR
jgi:hypothetical protein